jgi:hypothetical protein
MFDSVAKLEFGKDEEGNVDKTALAMISKEGEYVKFSQPCECTGPVSTPSLCMHCEFALNLSPSSSAAAPA